MDSNLNTDELDEADLNEFLSQDEKRKFVTSAVRKRQTEEQMVSEGGVSKGWLAVGFVCLGGSIGTGVGAVFVTNPIGQGILVGLAIVLAIAAAVRIRTS